MKKSIGKTDFYYDYIDSINKDIESKKKRLFELKNSRYHLINLIENKRFEDAYVVLPEHTPIEYIAYFYRVKDMQWHIKLDDCSILNRDKNIHNDAMFLKGTLYNVMKYNRVIKEVEDRIEELHGFIIPIDIYRAILTAYDNLLVGYLLDGKKYAFGYGLGTIYVLGKNRNYSKKIVDFNASNKERNRLLKNGLIPYKKEEAELAKLENREYNGIEWLIYNYEETSYWLHWYKGKFIKNIILYSFKPTIGNRTGQSVYELENSIKFENIPNYKIGFTQMIQLVRRMSSDYALKYRNNCSKS